MENSRFIIILYTIFIFRVFTSVYKYLFKFCIYCCAPASRPCGCIRHPLFCRREVRRRKKIVSARVVKTFVFNKDCYGVWLEPAVKLCGRALTCVSFCVIPVLVCFSCFVLKFFVLRNCVFIPECASARVWSGADSCAARVSRYIAPRAQQYN